MSRLQNVVILYGQLSGAGGAERVAIEEAKYFSERIKTKLLTFRVKDEALFGNDALKELEVIRWFGDKSSYMSPFSMVFRVLALRARLKELSPDIVIGCCWAGWIELYLATLFTPIPYVLHLHGSIFWLDKDSIKYALIHKRIFNVVRNSVPGHIEFINPKPKMGFLKRIGVELLAIFDYLSIRRAKALFVLSNHMRWEAERIYHRKAEVLPISPISNDMINFTPTLDVKKVLSVEGKQIVLSLSRLDSRKRIDLLIKAFARINKDFSDVVLVIGGKGPDEKRLKTLVWDLGLESKVFFVGFVNEKDLLNYYSACDLFAYPGWGDYAITVYEALAQQKKVICSSELEIESSVMATGFIFQAYPSVDSFAEGLKTALIAKVNGKIDPTDYVWAKYFEKINHYCEKVISA